MVEEQLRRKGISDESVLAAMGRVPRHLFVPEGMAPHAYEDRALPIGEDQTISQPYMVAVMTELLGPRTTDRVLEIGTGSAYQAAVLSLICREVFTVERIPVLHERAVEILQVCGFSNVTALLADGSPGLPEKAPFDGILVTAAAPEIPAPLLDQLADGGRLVAPVGPRHTQTLELVCRRGDRFERSTSTPCVFVPLIGQYGFR